MREGAVELLQAIGLSIVAAALLALLARAARQPLILGYVVAGALLGPRVGLGLVHDEASIELIAGIGLTLLLFLIGLELSVPRLLRAGRVIAVTGLLQFPISAGLAWLLLGRVAGGRPYHALYLAVALGLSSTLIVVKLLSDKFELGSFTGRVTLGVLVFQDLWAVAFLALQPNLGALEPWRLARSLGGGALLVALALLPARFLLPGLFRRIALAPELLLVTTMAWCFAIAGAAGWAGLSREMGALVAGMAIAAFPYGTEVVARVAGVRDFFVTLFFVALGLRAPEPSAHVFGLALGAAAVVALSRALAIFPLFALLRLDTRSAAVVTINLSQVSEFSLVIVTLGAGYGHVGPELVALVLYTLLATAVGSTYAILFNHALAAGLAHLLARTGAPRWLGGCARGPEAAEPADPETRDVFLLGVSREGLALLQQLEQKVPGLKARIVAIDFNPETLERLRRDGVECHYGDLANAEALRHAGLERATVVVSTISDWFLKGTDNLRLLRQAQTLAPRARVIVSADTLERAEQLYAAGADYVLVPPALAASHLSELLRDVSPEALAEARRRQRLEVFGEGA